MGAWSAREVCFDFFRVFQLPFTVRTHVRTSMTSYVLTNSTVLSEAGYGIGELPISIMLINRFSCFGRDDGVRKKMK